MGYWQKGPMAKIGLELPKNTKNGKRVQKLFKCLKLIFLRQTVLYNDLKGKTSFSSEWAKNGQGDFPRDLKLRKPTKIAFLIWIFLVLSLNKIQTKPPPVKHVS